MWYVDKMEQINQNVSIDLDQLKNSELVYFFRPFVWKKPIYKFLCEDSIITNIKAPSAIIEMATEMTDADHHPEQTIKNNSNNFEQVIENNSHNSEPSIENNSSKSEQVIENNNNNPEPSLEKHNSDSEQALDNKHSDSEPPFNDVLVSYEHILEKYK